MSTIDTYPIEAETCPCGKGGGCGGAAAQEPNSVSSPQANGGYLSVVVGTSGDVGGDGDAAVLRDEVVIDVFDAGGDLGPAEALRGCTGLAAEAASKRFVIHQQFEPLGERLWAQPGDKISCLRVLDGLLKATDARGYDRHATGHRLHRDEPEALVIRGYDADICRVVVER